MGAGATAAAGAAAAAVGAVAASHFFSDALTTVHVGDGARVRHTVANEVPVDAVALSHVYARTLKDATYELMTLVATGAVGRVTIGAELHGPGGHIDSTSLCLSDGQQVNDLDSRIAHCAPACTSNQLHKNVAAGRGRAIFAGKVVVDKAAQQTDSKQLCRSLLLSNRAQVDATPVLLINADDVKCTHGATASDLNEDELFYCQSRGLSAADGQALPVRVGVDHPRRVVGPRALKRQPEEGGDDARQGGHLKAGLPVHVQRGGEGVEPQRRHAGGADQPSPRLACRPR